MMFLVCEKSPENNIKYLIDYTNKNYIFKNLLELCQLLAGCGITDKMKPIRQGQKIISWIKQNPCWVFSYFQGLYMWCCEHINMKLETRAKFYDIQEDLLNYAFNYKLKYGDKPITTAIFRYKQGYECEYETNSELPIDICCQQYRKYIMEYKFKKDEVQNV